MEKQKSTKIFVEKFDITNFVVYICTIIVVVK